MSIVVEQLNSEMQDKRVLRLAIVSPTRRLEGDLSWLPTYPQTPEFISDERLQQDERLAIDAWLKERFPRGEFAPTESRLRPGLQDV